MAAPATASFDAAGPRGAAGPFPPVGRGLTPNMRSKGKKPNQGRNGQILTPALKALF
jgi:hypothetical protein